MSCLKKLYLSHVHLLPPPPLLPFLTALLGLGDLIFEAS
jgi:hypothetical protein